CLQGCVITLPGASACGSDCPGSCAGVACDATTFENNSMARSGWISLSREPAIFSSNRERGSDAQSGYGRSTARLCADVTLRKKDHGHLYRARPYGRKRSETPWPAAIFSNHPSNCLAHSLSLLWLHSNFHRDGNRAFLL